MHRPLPKLPQGPLAWRAFGRDLYLVEEHGGRSVVLAAVGSHLVTRQEFVRGVEGPEAGRLVPLTADTPLARTVQAVLSLRAACLAALNPTGHTDACMELRAEGVRECTAVCAGFRSALEEAGEDYPDPFGTFGHGAM